MLLWAGILFGSLDLLVPLEMSPAPPAEPRRAPRNVWKAPDAKGQPTKDTEGARDLCWEVQETGLEAVEGLAAQV